MFYSLTMIKNWGLFSVDENACVCVDVENGGDSINWVNLEGGRQGGDNIALIPFARVDDFVKGESSNPACPANFRVESRRKRASGSVVKPRVDGYLEYTLYVVIS
jgi:hypothetical protein